MGGRHHVPAPLWPTKTARGRATDRPRPAKMPWSSTPQHFGGSIFALGAVAGAFWPVGCLCGNGRRGILAGWLPLREWSPGHFGGLTTFGGLVAGAFWRAYCLRGTGRRGVLAGCRPTRARLQGDLGGWGLSLTRGCCRFHQVCAAPSLLPPLARRQIARLTSCPASSLARRAFWLARRLARTGRLAGLWLRLAPWPFRRRRPRPARRACGRAER